MTVKLPETFEAVTKIEDAGERDEAIRLWAEKEANGEVVDGKLVPKKEKKPDDTPEDTPPDKEVVDTPEDSKEETPPEEPEEKPDSEEETPADEKPEGEETPPKDTPPEPTEEERTKAREERVNELVVKHNMPKEQAEKLDESINKNIVKYGGNPDKADKTLREAVKASIFAQQMYSKLQNSIREAERMSLNPFEWKGDTCHFKTQDGKTVTKTADELVSAYRENNPDEVQDLDDKAVLALVKQDQKTWFDQKSREQLGRVGQIAKEKVDTFVNALPNDKFKDQISHAMKGLDPLEIAKGFDLNNVVELVKGKHYDADKASWEKETEKKVKEAYEKGKKDSKVAGRVTPDTVGSGKKKITGTSLTESQKIDAQKMFNQRGDMKDDEVYKLYEDYLKETKKDKK